MFNLPPFPMMHVANLTGRFRAGYWISDASPIEQVAKSETPTLFIHGDTDDFVPYYMLDEIYNAASAPKEKLVIEIEGHAKAHTVNPELYWETVNNFLSEYIK